MDISVLSSLGMGGLASIVFQSAKGEWHPWLNKAIALATGFGAGYTVGGPDGGLVAAVTTLAAHSTFFANTKLGTALKVNLLPRLLNLLSELAANLSKAISNT